MRKNFIPKILNAIVILGISITCILYLINPLIVKDFLKSRYSISDYRMVITISTCIYLLGVPYIIALFKLRELCGLVVKNNPFSIESVKSLKVISMCCFSELIFIIGCEKYLDYSMEGFKYIPTGLPIAALTIICLTIGLLCIVLSQLFEIAIKIKEENDETI
ncbi:Protein of unknown function [Clostridium amylolyticum]|uniref:DUF2975 domain-containing protein n=1 Tax=Clostridium amylolyticum TaxID=1121298 RepID=A0A1M6PCG3_9CLOT|nr:DUF2975 domain-containing protein [Clostridium amylolyticum]SHK05645.1 Protein of unknown function [Clostridium amylolyticum]